MVPPHGSAVHDRIQDKCVEGLAANTCGPRAQLTRRRTDVAEGQAQALPRGLQRPVWGDQGVGPLWHCSVVGAPVLAGCCRARSFFNAAQCSICSCQILRAV